MWDQRRSVDQRRSGLALTGSRGGALVLVAGYAIVFVAVVALWGLSVGALGVILLLGLPFGVLGAHVEMSPDIRQARVVVAFGWTAAFAVISAIAIAGSWGGALVPVLIAVPLLAWANVRFLRSRGSRTS
jgi:hypothetical protein